MKRIPLIRILSVALVMSFATPVIASAHVKSPHPVLTPPAKRQHAKAPVKHRHTWQRGGHAVVIAPSHASRVWKAIQLSLRSSGSMAYSQSGSRGYLPMNSFPPATDCSGWATWVLRMGGINVPLGTTYTFMNWGRAIPTSERYLKLGDMVIYNGHMEVYVGNGRTVGHGSPGIHWHSWNYRPVIGVRRFFNV